MKIRQSKFKILTINLFLTRIDYILSYFLYWPMARLCSRSFLKASIQLAGGQFQNTGQRQVWQKNLSSSQNPDSRETLFYEIIQNKSWVLDSTNQLLFFKMFIEPTKSNLPYYA